MSMFGSSGEVNERAILTFTTANTVLANGTARNGGYIELNPTAAASQTLAGPLRLNCELVLNQINSTFTTTITVTGGFNQAGATVLTFRAAGEYTILKSELSDTGLVWRLIASSESVLWPVQPADTLPLPIGNGINLAIPAGAGAHGLVGPGAFGQKLTLSVTTDAGGSLTIAPIVAAGFDRQLREGGLDPGVIFFANRRDIIKLEAVADDGNLAWALVSEDLGAGSFVS